MMILVQIVILITMKNPIRSQLAELECQVENSNQRSPLLQVKNSLFILGETFIFTRSLSPLLHVGLSFSTPKRKFSCVYFKNTDFHYVCFHHVLNLSDNSSLISLLFTAACSLYVEFSLFIQYQLSLNNVKVMEYYSKSVAPWCPSSCSCTFYHFARVQGPSPPSYTGEI